MFGLEYRNELPKRVVDELDKLVGRLRRYLTKEHDEEGNHLGVTYSGAVTHITVVNGIVTSVS